MEGAKGGGGRGNRREERERRGEKNWEGRNKLICSQMT